MHQICPAGGFECIRRHARYAVLRKESEGARDCPQHRYGFPVLLRHGEHTGLKQTVEGLFWFLAFKQRKKVIYYVADAADFQGAERKGGSARRFLEDVRGKF